MKRIIPAGHVGITAGQSLPLLSFSFACLAPEEEMVNEENGMFPVHRRGGAKHSNMVV